MSGLSFGIYDASDSDEALRLEARSPQGRAFRLRFERSHFHRRAENFEQWRLVTARRGGELVGVAGGALKPVLRDGRPTTAAYAFDVRVAPEERRGRVAQRLIQELAVWAKPSAEFSYGYIVGDNDASSQLATRIFGTSSAPACHYLVYPVYRRSRADQRVQEVSAGEAHTAYLARSGPFDFYSDPSPSFISPGYIGSWALGESAGCSAWSNAGIMSEVVDRVPPSLAVVGALLGRGPLSALPLPHVPRAGETVRSWYLFDFHAVDGASAVDLMNCVAASARARRIDFCYIIHRGDEPWIADLRRQSPRMFAPVIPYSIVSQRLDTWAPITFNAPYIDIRDV